MPMILIPLQTYRHITIGIPATKSYKYTAEMDEVLVKYENEATIWILGRVHYWEVPFLREGQTF